ncbi:lactate racemase domain-containing protein [Chloroflexota bacterium]
MANIIKLPQYIWYDPKEVDFPLPDSWQVTVNNIAGYNKPAMKADDIKAAVTSPIGMLPLREYAKGKKEAVIIFDDLTRGTRVTEIVPFILEELAEAGITDDRIRFIAGIANHNALDRRGMVSKLGEDVVARFPVYNHVPFINCTDIGTTSYGTEVSINSEVMHCDLKIAIGGILPHVQYGFSGGAKLIIPGISSYETVTAHHGITHNAWKADQRKTGKPLLGNIDSPMHADAMEVAEMVGLDMLVNTIPNGFGETAAVFAGALRPAYEKAVETAKAHYAAPNTRNSDIVIANAFIKASEFNMGFSGMQAIKPEGGSFVLIAGSPSGQVIHYLFDNFGKTISGAVSQNFPVPPHIEKIIFYNEFPEAKLYGKFVNPEKVLQTNNWKEVIETLVKAHGNEAKVAVYPNADTLYFPG